MGAPAKGSCKQTIWLTESCLLVPSPFHVYLFNILCLLHVLGWLKKKLPLIRIQLLIMQISSGAKFLKIWNVSDTGSTQHSNASVLLCCSWEVMNLSEYKGNRVITLFLWVIFNLKILAQMKVLKYAVLI